MRPTAMITICT